MAFGSFGLLIVILLAVIVLGGGFALIYALMGMFEKDKPSRE